VAVSLKIACVLALAATAAARADDGPVRLSLPTESDRAAWREPGFRLGIGVGFGELAGIGGAPSGRLLGPVLRLGARLDADWSILATLEYLSASARGGLAGLRYAGTIEPTWHATPSLSLALGVGFAGIVEGATGRPDPGPTPSTLTDPFTLPDASHPLASCSGDGVVGLGRVEWLAVLGPRASTGATLELGMQWTGCVASTGHVEPDTAQPIVRRQWWPHASALVGWIVEWR
jgi:hypothetical protein